MAVLDSSSPFVRTFRAEAREHHPFQARSQTHRALSGGWFPSALSFLGEVGVVLQFRPESWILLSHLHPLLTSLHTPLLWRSLFSEQLSRCTATLSCQLHPKVSTCTDPTHLLKSPLSGLQAALRSQEVQIDTQGLPHARFPFSFWISGLPGWPRTTEQEPFLLTPPGSCPLQERDTVAAFSFGRRRSGGRRCGGEGGPAQVPSNPSGVPTPPVPSRVVELKRPTRGPAPPASPTFRRPLGSAHAGRLRSSARKGRFVTAPRAPRHRAARAADPGTRPSRGRD